MGFPSRQSLSAVRRSALLRRAGLLAAFLSAFSTGWAAPVSYTSGYRAKVLPTETAGTEAQPLWYLQTHEGDVAAVDDGILSASTMQAADETNRLQFWQIGQDGEREYGTPSNSWANPAGGSTVDFTVKVKESKSDDIATSGVPGGFEIQAAGGGYAINFYFDTQGITAWGATTTVDDIHPNGEFTTYRIVLQNGRAALYEAGKDPPIFSDLAMRSAPENFDVINFGTVTTSTSGAWELTFLGWSNHIAEFSPPPASP